MAARVKALINPALITWARETAGFTTAEAAKGRSGADPFVIALASTTNPSMVVVTEEFAGKTRIPDVCLAERIDCCRLPDLIEREDWKFGK